jgi:hypothetical protein
MLVAIEAGADLADGTCYAEGAESSRGFSALRLLVAGVRFD